MNKLCFWLRNSSVELCSVRMLEPECARLSGIQFHERPKLQGAFASDVLAFNLDDDVTGLHAGGLRKRALNHLAHTNLCDDRIEKKTFALDVDGETESLVSGAAGLREHEHEQENQRDSNDVLRAHRT